MSNYTLGPWTIPEKVVAWEKDDRGCVYWDFPVRIGALDTCVRGETKKEAEANARLIAAAPDLLEALKRVEHYLQGDRTGRDFEESDVVGIVQAAIAKAEGKP